MFFKIHCFRPFIERFSRDARLTQELELIERYISWQGGKYHVVEADRPHKSSQGLWVTNGEEFIGGFHRLVSYFNDLGLLLI